MRFVTFHPVGHHPADAIVLAGTSEDIVVDMLSPLGVTTYGRPS